MKNVSFTSIPNNKWIYPIFLIVCAFAAYYPVLGNDFQNLWDDQFLVINGYTESGWNAYNIRAIFTDFYSGQYAPLNELLYVAIYSLCGYSPFWFHLANLLLHIANALLVYLCIRRLLELSGKISVEHKELITFITALLFTLQPLNVEPVAWITASKILLSSFYYLLATYTFLSYLKHGKLKYYFFTLFLFICSFLSKEHAVSFPFWLLLIYWITGRRLKDRKVWLAVTPFLLLTLLFGIVASFSQTGGIVLFNKADYPLWQRLVFACYSFTEYLLKSAFPFKLLYLYPFPSVAGDPLPQWLLLYPTLLTVFLIALWKQIVTNKAILAGLLFFLIHIAIVLHIVPLPRFYVVADRYMYLAYIGFGFALAYYGMYFLRKWKDYRRTGLIVAFSVYLLYFGVYTNIRCRVWHDTDSLKKEIRELLKERNDYELKIKN